MGGVFDTAMATTDDAIIKQDRYFFLKKTAGREYTLFKRGSWRFADISTDVGRVMLLVGMWCLVVGDDEDVTDQWPEEQQEEALKALWAKRVTL